MAEAEARAEAARGAEELAALRRELVRERGAAAAAAAAAEGQERALRGEVTSRIATPVATPHPHTPHLHHPYTSQVVSRQRRLTLP